MGSFKSHSLKKNILQVVDVVCVHSAWETAKRTVWHPRCSRGPWSSSSFFRQTSRFPEVLNPQQNGFSVRYSVPRGDLVASTERTLHRYDSDFAKSRFRRQMRAARWTTPSLRLRSAVTGTSQLPAPVEPNPTLLRPPLPSRWPTKIMEVILPHSVRIVSHCVSPTCLTSEFSSSGRYIQRHTRTANPVNRCAYVQLHWLYYWLWNSLNQILYNQVIALNRKCVM